MVSRRGFDQEMDKFTSKAKTKEKNEVFREGSLRLSLKKSNSEEETTLESSFLLCNVRETGQGGRKRKKGTGKAYELRRRASKG